MEIKAKGAYMKNNYKLVLCLASSLLLMGCGNSRSSSTTEDTGTSEVTNTDTKVSTTETTTETTTVTTEQIVVAIDEVEPLLPGKSVQLVAKVKGEAVTAAWEIVTTETDCEVSAAGLFKAGAYEEAVKVKATYEGVSATTNISVVAPTLDASKINVPASWRATVALEGETDEVQTVGTVEFVEGKGVLITSISEKKSAGYLIEEGEVYQFQGDLTKATFNYVANKISPTTTKEDVAKLFSLSAAVRVDELDFFCLNEENNTYEFDPDYGATYEDSAIESLVYSFSLDKLGFNSFTVIIDAETLAFKDIAILAIDSQGAETARMELGITAIEDFSVTVTGEHVSDGGEGEGGVTEPFEPDPVTPTPDAPATGEGE